MGEGGSGNVLIVAGKWILKAILVVLVAITVISVARFGVAKTIDIFVNTVRAGFGVDLNELSDNNDLSGAQSNLNTLDQWENVRDVEGFQSGGFGGVFSD